MPMTGGEISIQGGLLQDSMNTFLATLAPADVRIVDHDAVSCAKYGNRILLRGFIVYEKNIP